MLSINLKYAQIYYCCFVQLKITHQLDKACQLSVSEQKASSEFVNQLQLDFEAYANNLTPRLAAGLDPEAAALLTALKKKSRVAETILADLEDQVETLTVQADAQCEQYRRSSSKSKICTGDIPSRLVAAKSSLS